MLVITTAPVVLCAFVTTRTVIGWADLRGWRQRKDGEALRYQV